LRSFGLERRRGHRNPPICCSYVAKFLMWCPPVSFREIPRDFTADGHITSRLTKPLCGRKLIGLGAAHEPSQSRWADIRRHHRHGGHLPFVRIGLGSILACVTLTSGCHLRQDEITPARGPFFWR